MIYSGRTNSNRLVVSAIILLLIIWIFKINSTHSLVLGWFRGEERFTPVQIPFTVEEAFETKVTATDAPIASSGVISSKDGKESHQELDEPAKEAAKKFKYTVVMGRTQADDTRWVKEYLPDWRHAIYSVDEPTNEVYLHTPKNKGKESMAYLTYLIDFYDVLTDVQVFVHSHGSGYPKAWHNEPQSVNYNAGQMIQLLRMDTITKNGYVNLRCNGVPGCPGEVHPKTPPSKLKPDRIEIGWMSLWVALGGNAMNPPKTVGVACCAQFAVTKDQIRKHPKEYYEKAREWLLNTDLSDESSGRAFEYMWHIIFGMKAVHCAKDYGQCICETYDCSALNRLRKRGVNTIGPFV